MAVRHFELQNTVCIAVSKYRRFTQVSNSSLAFFAQVMSFSSLLMENLSSPSNLESLLGTAVCFHFWHIILN